jgi:hypothetical protein
MFDLIKLKEQLEKAIKARDNWQMNGYDTPYLTYHEQLDLHQEKVERLANKIRKELGE